IRMTVSIHQNVCQRDEILHARKNPFPPLRFIKSSGGKELLSIPMKPETNPVFATQAFPFSG
ncbi:MAG: hypothetical protein ACOC8I_03080, partial [Desulfosalsimonas sp.]